MASATNSLRSLLLRSATRPVATGLQPSIYSTASTTALFSTTATLSAAPLKGKKSAGAPQSTKQKKNYKKKKAQSAAPMKKPNPGERKAFRKRIQLSNNSAIEVQGTEPLTADVMVDAASAGKLFALSDQLVDQLRTLEAFKPTQSWNLFRKPHVLLRAELVDLMAKLEGSVSSKEAARIVLRGSRLSGKSLALLQAMSYALLKNWVVINLPEGNSLNESHLSPVPFQIVNCYDSQRSHQWKH